MEKYLAIITTVLVLTQVIRLIQNTIQLINFKKARKYEQSVVLETWKALESAVIKLCDKLESEENSND